MSQQQASGVVHPDLAEIRKQLPALDAGVYLNTGTCGPLARAAAESIQRELADQLYQGRIHPRRFQEIFADLRAIRTSIARLLAAPPETIALAGSTTDGLNTVLWGLDWSPGDEVLTTRYEHEGLLAPLAALRERFGVVIRRLTFDPFDPAATVRAFAEAAGRRTRLLAFSHVLYTNGAVLPVRDLARLAVDRDALTVVDGAQSAGALPVRPQELGVDAYAVPGQKWLCGPEGTGALYVAPRALEHLRVTRAGYLSGASWAEDKSSFQPAEGAARFEAFLPSLYNFRGLAAGLDWLEGLGWDWIFRRTAALAERLAHSLAELPGVELLTGEAETRSGLVSFRVPGRPDEEICSALAAQGFWLRTIPEPFGGVRASTGFYNTEEELDALAGAVAGMAG